MPPFCRSATPDPLALSSSSTVSSSTVTTRLLLAVSLLSVFGCGAPSYSAKTPEYRRQVGSVEIRGNRVLSDDQIIEGLANRGPEGLLFFRETRIYRPAEVARDAERIRGVYRQHGYFNAEVVDIAIDKKDAIDLVFEVREGAPVLLDDIGIEWKQLPDGRYAESTETLRREIQDDTLLFECCREHTRKGDVFDHVDYLDAKKRLLEFFAMRGYAEAKVDGRVEVDLQKNSAQVRFEVDPGPRMRLGTTRIRGLAKVPASVVRNRISWDEGDIYDPEEIETTRGRLLRLGRFSSVSIDSNARAEGDDIVDMEIRLHEERLREVRLGGGAAVDPVQWEVRARAEYTKSNIFFDPRTSLRARFQPAYRWLRASTDRLGLAGEALVSLERIDFAFPLVTAEADVAYGVERYESYTSRGPRTRVSLRRPFVGERLYLGAAWNLAVAEFPELSSAIADDPSFSERLGVDGDQYRVGYYEQTAALDLRDDAVDPHLGLYVGLRLEEGTEYAGSLFDYASGELDVRGYLPLAPRWVFAARARHTQLLAGESLPLTRRLFAGGASSHRGFAQRRLSPVRMQEEGEEVALVGGNLRFESSAELRWDVYPFMNDWIGAVAFVDAGEVTEEADAFAFTGLHWAVGLGLRLGTLVGPVRADLGYRLNQKGPGQPAAGDDLAFHLSIGEAF